jgi:hypothetical protein
MRRLFEALARPWPLAGHRSIDTNASSCLCARLAGVLALTLAAGGCVAEPMSAPLEASAIKIPRPNAGLLAREPAPQCEYTDARSLPASPGSSVADPTPGSNVQMQASLALEDARRRERERDCYRDAEHRVRTKLTRLQSSVRTTLQAIEKQNRELH